MSDEDKADEVSKRGMAFIAPEGHLHPSAGKVDSNEQTTLAIYKGLSGLLSKAETDINENPDKIDLHIVHTTAEIVDLYNDFGAAKDGFRSKQITKWGGSTRSGVSVEPEEGRGWKFWKRKKEDVAEG